MRAAILGRRSTPVKLQDRPSLSARSGVPTRPAKGDQSRKVELHSPTSPEEYSVLIMCGDAATLDAIVNTASRMNGVRVVVENPEASL